MNHEKTNASWKNQEKLIANNFYHKNMTMGDQNDHEHLVKDSGLHLACRCIPSK